MGLFDLPVNIRLETYSQLLILPEPIEFVMVYGPPLPPHFRSRRDGLHPAILRANKKVYGEASLLLYSNNRFQFPEDFCSEPLAPTSAHVAPFLALIRLQARNIRHISIPFPTFDYPVPDTATLHQVHIDSLELIRETCTDLETLELLVPNEHCNYALGDWALATDILRILNIGWIVTITKLPQRMWISNDNRVEFDNEKDCIAYDNEQYRRELELEEQREEEEWLEDYYRKRRDPYWKNDSDYD